MRLATEIHLNTPSNFADAGMKLPVEPAAVASDEIESLRAMSLAERGRLVAIACRSASRLAQSRKRAGFAEPQPEPWPQSTWDFLRSHAAHDRE